MRKNTILILIAAIILVFALLLSINLKDSLIGSSSNSDSQENAGQNSQSQSQTQNNQQLSENIIEMSSSGFSPSTLTIQQGEKVIFKAVDSSNKWPASSVHPTHRVYPGSDIEKCGTPEEPNIFDSCRGIPEGEAYEFIFNEIGTWNYHDHLDTSGRGKIIVQ